MAWLAKRGPFWGAHGTEGESEPMAFLPGAPENHLSGLDVTMVGGGERKSQRALGPSPHPDGPLSRPEAQL